MTRPALRAVPCGIALAITLASAGGLAPVTLVAQAPVLAPARDTTLTLGGAARLGARQGLSATIAGLRAEGAAARVEQARAGFYPTVTASAGDGQRTFNTASFGFALPGLDPNGEVRGPVRTVDVRGRVTANLLAPATIARYRAAQAASAGAGTEALVAAEAAGAAAANAYVRLLRAEAQVSARSADSSLASELLVIAQRQLRAGTGIGLDVTRAQAQLAGVRTQLISARSERDRARVALLRSLSLPVTMRIALGDSLAALAEATVEPPAATAVRAERADVRAARAAVETARRAMNATKAEKLPALGVYGDDGATSSSYTHLLNTYTVGVQVSVPIFDGFRLGARVDEQGAMLREAEARARDVEAQVDAELATALLDLSSAREQLDASRDRLRLAEQEVSQARERFRAGVAGNADVIAAQLGLDAARSQHIDVQSALVSARVALARAEGRVTTLP